MKSDVDLGRLMAAPAESRKSDRAVRLLPPDLPGNGGRETDFGRLITHYAGNPRRGMSAPALRMHRSGCNRARESKYREAKYREPGPIGNITQCTHHDMSKFRPFHRSKRHFSGRLALEH
jgi:hypothetical protein